MGPCIVSNIALHRLVLNREKRVHSSAWAYSKQMLRKRAKQARATSKAVCAPWCIVENVEMCQYSDTNAVSSARFFLDFVELVWMVRAALRIIYER